MATNPFQKLGAAADLVKWSRDEADRMIALPSEARGAAFRADAKFLEDADVIRVLEKCENPVRVADEVWPDREDRPAYVAEALGRFAGRLAVARVAEALARRAAAGTDATSRPAAGGSLWIPQHDGPRFDDGRTSIAEFRRFLNALRSWASSERPAAKGDAADDLDRVIQYARAVERVLTFVQEHVGDEMVGDVPAGTGIEPLMRTLVQAALDGRQRRRRAVVVENRGIAEVVVWWQGEFVFAHQIEAPVRAAMANLGTSRELPQRITAGYDPNLPIVNIWPKDQADAVAPAIKRMQTARDTILLCEAELERCRQPAALRCDPSDAVAVARDLTWRPVEAKIGYRHQVEIVCALAIVAPMALYGLVMLVAGRRRILDAGLILWEAGPSLPILVAVTAVAVGAELVRRYRRQAHASWRVRDRLWAAEALVGVLAVLSLLQIPASQVPAGVLTGEPSDEPALIFERHYSEPRTDRSGRITVGEVAVLRGPWRGRRWPVTAAELKELHGR